MLEQHASQQWPQWTKELEALTHFFWTVEYHWTLRPLPGAQASKNDWYWVSGYPSQERLNGGLIRYRNIKQCGVFVHNCEEQICASYMCMCGWERVNERNLRNKLWKGRQIERALLPSSSQGFLCCFCLLMCRGIYQAQTSKIAEKLERRPRKESCFHASDEKRKPVWTLICSVHAFLFIWLIQFAVDSSWSVIWTCGYALYSCDNVQISA